MTTPSLLTPVEADPRLGPLVQSVLTCACAELAAADRPVCACCVTWGDTRPPADFCDCVSGDCSGQAWARVVRIDPAQTSNRLPALRCQPMRIRAWIELGVYRCVPSVAPDGTSAPTCEQRTQSSWGLLADARALRQALSCCDALRDERVEFLSEEPVSPLGGCAGLALQFAVDL